MRDSTVDGMVCVFLHVEREQSVLSRVWPGVARSCVRVCVWTFALTALSSAQTQVVGLKAEPICSQSWFLLSGPSLLSKEVESWHLWSQILSYWAMLHVREYWNFRYLLLPCLKYCLCPAPFISTILDFALSFFHTRTYWNAWKKKHLSCVLWFMFILSIRIVSLFVWGEGKLSVWYWDKTSTVYLLKILTDDLVPGSNRRSRNKTKPHKLRQRCKYWTGGLWRQHHSSSRPLPAFRQIRV